ncbi:MAG: hypothetical protein KA226_09025 [Gemmatimonadales bacterium]|nr:hypothetical protein [Gemmatimonadales bacterium]
MPTTLSRSLLAVLIPGFVAIAPWLLALVQHTDATLGLATYPSLGNVLLFAAAAVVGSVFEGLGTFLEVRWDREREPSHAVFENWYGYLSTCLPIEPVGYRYLSRLATTMYFEMSMLFAAPLFALGATVLAALRFPQFKGGIWLFGATASLATAFYFHWQARSTHGTLCKTRREINNRLGVAYIHSVGT